jgi:hypothetical protein
VVEWRVDRQKDDNPGLFYAVNTGHDSACEVTLLPWDGQEKVRSVLTSCHLIAMGPRMIQFPTSNFGYSTCLQALGLAKKAQVLRSRLRLHNLRR